MLELYFSSYSIFQPIVAIPVAGDQPINAKESEKMGFGVSVPYANLNEKDLHKAIKKVLQVPAYLKNAQKYGSMLNDQITKPLDRAVWWIEHVIKHPKMYQGKSPANKLYWFQYFLLDVILFYLIISYCFIKVVKFIFSKLLFFCFSFKRRIKEDWKTKPIAKRKRTVLWESETIPLLISMFGKGLDKISWFHFVLRRCLE